MWVLYTQYIPEEDPPDDSSSCFDDNEAQAVPETSSDSEIEYLHSKESRVLEIEATPIHSKERKRLMTLLQNDGNHLHNCLVRSILKNTSLSLSLYLSLSIYLSISISLSIYLSISLSLSLYLSIYALLPSYLPSITQPARL